ncbi:MAG: hypothetical protein Q9168_000311 [Polycauliona sp. 1 TL-2023]
MLTEFHRRLGQATVLEFLWSWRELSGQYYLLHSYQYVYELVSGKALHERHKNMACPMRKTVKHIGSLLPVLNHDAFPYLLGKFTTSWNGIFRMLAGSRSVRLTPLGSAQFEQLYIQCRHTQKQVSLSLQYLRKEVSKGSMTPGSIILGGPLRQYLVSEPPRGQISEKTAPNDDNLPTSPVLDESSRTHGQRNGPIQHLLWESKRTELGPDFMEIRAQRSRPTNPVLQPRQGSGISLKGTLVSSRRRATFHPGTTVTTPSIRIAAVANGTGPEKLEKPKGSDDSLPKKEIQSPFACLDSSNRMREGALASTRSRRDQSEHHSEQGARSWDSRRSILSRISPSRRILQLSKGMHSCTGTLTGPHQRPPEGYGKYQNVKSTPRLLPTGTGRAQQALRAHGRVSQSAGPQSHVDILPDQDRWFIKSRSEFPEYEQSSRLARRFRTSLYELVDDLGWLIGNSPRCVTRSKLLVSTCELKAGWNEIAKLAHDARWWCRFREEWHALAQNRTSSRSSLSYMSAILHRRLDGEVNAKLAVSWDEIYTRYDLLKKFGKAHVLGSLYTLDKAYVMLIQPLNQTFREIKEILRLGDGEVSKKELGPISRLHQSWVPVRRLKDELVGRSVALRFLTPFSRCYGSYKALRNSLILVYNEMSMDSALRIHLFGDRSVESYAGERLSVGTRLVGSVEQHSPSTLIRGPRLERISQYEAVEPPLRRGASDRFWKTRNEPHVMSEGGHSSSLNNFGLLRAWPSSSSIRARRPLEASSRVARRQTASLHTSAHASSSSSIQNEEVTTNDRSRSGEEIVGDDSDMVGHQLSSPLGYHIPSHKMRDSMLASRSSRSAYWQYNLYEGPRGQKVKVHYCRSLETTERIARLFLNESVIGFDIEWKPSATVKDGIRKNVALIQLASEERIALFHIARFSKEDNIESLVAPTFKAIMESSSIIKVGVFVKGDCTRLRNHMSIDSHGLFELSYLHKLVKFSLTDVKKINRRLVALAKQVEEHLMLPMSKDENVRASDWSEELNYQQISC